MPSAVRIASACVDLPAPFGPAKMTTRGGRFVFFVMSKRRLSFEIYDGAMLRALRLKFELN